MVQPRVIASTANVNKQDMLLPNIDVNIGSSGSTAPAPAESTLADPAARQALIDSLEERAKRLMGNMDTAPLVKGTQNAGKWGGAKGGIPVTSMQEPVTTARLEDIMAADPMHSNQKNFITKEDVLAKELQAA